MEVAEEKIDHMGVYRTIWRQANASHRRVDSFVRYVRERIGIPVFVLCAIAGLGLYARSLDDSSRSFEFEASVLLYVFAICAATWAVTWFLSLGVKQRASRGFDEQRHTAMSYYMKLCAPEADFGWQIDPNYPARVFRYSDIEGSDRVVVFDIDIEQFELWSNDDFTNRVEVTPNYQIAHVFLRLKD